VILRLLNLVVIGALVLAAAYVYRIKYDATLQAERLAKLRGEVRQERDRIAALQAEWEQLDNPERIEALARRFLQLQPIAPTQFDTLDRLPERPPQGIAASSDPIGGIIDDLEQPNTVGPTGSIPPTALANRNGSAPRASMPQGAAMGTSRQ
jgi:cell division protein FtsL